ncbi:conserved hypothetical protein [Rhodopseudomonas palustris TIE-1]|uniref:hypothetical protein n=1 Tax=Rhodopseudomonas palustris TaxID=1076 RepID=UPI000164A7EF|nr:hypothetical protein [Rhodopseudomonas palustris]ACF01887.1 conserved hypothetical protein [Rhodopseudomonas palustris TIE-1]
MTINVSDLAPWVAIAISAAALWYAIYSGRSKVTEEKFKELSSWIETKASKDHVAVLAAKLDVVEDKVTVIDNELKHLPDNQTVQKLEGMIGTLSRDVSVLSERIRPVAAIADRLQEKIMESVEIAR